MPHLHALGIHYSFACQVWDFFWLLDTTQPMLRTGGSIVELALPGNIPPQINDEIWWINTPAPSPLHAVTLKCLLYTASQRFPKELSPSCSSGNLFDLIISPLFPAIPVSFQHFPSSVFWDPLHLNPCLNVSFLENPTKVKENEKSKDSHYLNWLSLKARTDSSEKGISCGTC